jgi:uncharacterized protein
VKNVAVILLAILAAASACAAEPSATDSHMLAATELLQTMNLEKQMAAGTNTMADLMIKQNPTLAPYKDVILKWAAGFMTWDVFGARLAVMYRDAYTESELRDLAAFYKSPTGQKYLTVMPKMMHDQAELGSMVAVEHADKLQAMIRARTEEIQRLTKPQ